MEVAETKSFAYNTDNMHKSAIIYRDESASFIYVCYHCGHMFNEINETLEHIESHFQLPIDKFSDEGQDCFTITSPSETVDVKVEILDVSEIGAANVHSKPVKKYEKEEFRCKDLRKRNEIVKVKSKKTVTDVLADEKGCPEEEGAVERSYQCHKCPKTYGLVSQLKRHMKVYTNGELLQIFKCKECDCYYRNTIALRLHVLEKHFMTNGFNCNDCTEHFQFSQAKEFEDHLHQHILEPGKKWSKDIRDLIYHPKGDFTKFEEMDSFTEERFSCEFCTQRFYTKSNLEVHMKHIHASQRRLQCRQCSAIFATPKYYFAHQLEHKRVGPEITECDDNVLLANLDGLADERIIHHEHEFGQRSFSCAICSFKCDLQCNIRYHILKKHIYSLFPQPLEPHREVICDLCGTVFKSKFYLTQHMKIHTNTKTHACSICGKLFRLTSDRNIHERQHTGEKPFQCDECGKAFISKGLLTAHRKSHDDTTYPCHICGKSFNLPSGYRNHVKRHNEDRSFKCTICTKSFNTRTNLTRHLVIHSDKQFPCRYCESTFNSDAGRRQHHRHKHRIELR